MPTDPIDLTARLNGDIEFHEPTRQFRLPLLIEGETEINESLNPIHLRSRTTLILDEKMVQYLATLLEAIHLQDESRQE
jgi:hypothetical protein